MAAIVSLLVCLGLTRHQLGYWQNDETLFRHAIAVTGGNYLAHNNLAIACDRRGNLDAAIDHLREAIRLKPEYAEAHKDLGVLLFKNGQTDGAIGELQAALRVSPDFPSAQAILAKVLALKNGSTGNPSAAPH